MEDDWHRRAACLDRTDVNFFPSKGEDPRPARAVCATCDVQPDCLQSALDRREVHGIWGGMSERERRRLRKDRLRRIVCCACGVEFFSASGRWRRCPECSDERRRETRSGARPQRESA